VRSLPCICTLSLHATSVLFFFLCSRHPRDLHSFPTRRSSDLSTSLRGAHTPIYASPQQVRGEAPDPRDDVHALGVIWYQLLTGRSEEHTSELQSRGHLVCRLLLEKKKKKKNTLTAHRPLPVIH